MNYQIIPPPPVLREYVRYFWVVEYDGLSNFKQEFDTVVDDSSGIIFQHHNGHSCFLDENNDRVMVGLIYGKQTKPFRSFSDVPFSATGVNFTTQGLKLFFKVDAFELTDRKVDFGEFTNTSIVEQLMDFKSQNEKIKTLSSFLTSLVDLDNRRDELILHCCSRIRSGAFNSRVSDLSKIYGISERQLERRFNQSVGLSPKLFMRITKFQNAMKGIMEGDFKKLSEIAYDLEYSDQSRFISDIKEFTNYTPTEVVQNMKKILLLDEK